LSSPVEIKSVEGEDIYLTARPESPSGEVLTIIEVSAAALAVYEVGNPTAVYAKTLSVLFDPPGAGYNECMFATLKTDGWWTLAGGYTFWAVIRATDFALKGGKPYRIEVKLVTGHTATSWPSLAAYGDQLYIWNTTPSPTGSA